MADSKTTALTALTAADPANDMMPIVDVSDTSMAASGTTKRISINNILACSPAATLASATITGDLTVDTSTLKVDSANNRVGIGTASPAVALDVVGSAQFSGNLTMSTGSLNSQYWYGISATSMLSSGSGSWPLLFGINGSEKARIDASANLLVGQTTQSVSTVGISLNSNGAIVGCVNGGAILYVNRKVSDGTLVSFLQDNTEEGTISVSGNTVSYNNFAGSHASQLQDGSKTEILRGTVMESINELCVWPNEENERLPKSKISDTAGSKNVYGVFMAWDNEWTTTNDFLVTAVGAFICRVNGSITVQEGDLLESNGDGTARVQSDDIIRSSTIGKVTSTVKTYQYDDGSYCVPTVLYCG